MRKLTSSFLMDNLIGADDVSKNKGIFIIRHSFFYTHGKTAENFRDDISKQLEKLNVVFEILDFGEIWKPFKGGASIRNQSHWFVKIKLL